MKRRGKDGLAVRKEVGIAVGVIGLVIGLTLAPAAEAAKGGNGGGGESCTTIHWSYVDRIDGERYRVTAEVCDNPTSGEADCSSLGAEFEVAAWQAGKTPDRNSDGLTCIRIIEVRLA